MDETKPWWQSTTVWASVFTMATGLGVAMNVLTADQAKAVMAEGPGLVLGALNVFFGAWALYGRVVATKQIG